MEIGISGSNNRRLILQYNDKAHTYIVQYFFKRLYGVSHQLECTY